MGGHDALHDGAPPVQVWVRHREFLCLSAFRSNDAAKRDRTKPGILPFSFYLHATGRDPDVVTPEPPSEQARNLEAPDAHAHWPRRA